MHMRSFALLPATRGGRLEAAGVPIGDGWAILRETCRRFPLRHVGSAGERGNARFVARHLEAAGLRRVRIEPVPCLGFDVRGCDVRLGGPGGQALDALPVMFSGSTPPDGVSAPLAYADDAGFVDFSSPDLRGKILLVFGWFGDFSTTDYYRKALEAGLAGVIVIRDSDHAVSYGLPPAAARIGSVPVVSVSHPAGTAILRSRVREAFLRVRQASRPVNGSNVVGLLPANRKRLDDRVLLLSTHLDAPPVRPAAADNAVGAAMAVEVLRALAGVERRRDIWFAGYTDEEWGFSGARQFARDHAEIAHRCHGQFYYDGHGTAVGVNKLVVTGPPALVEFMERVAADIAHPMKVEERTNTLDPMLLFADGVPAVQIERHPQRTWHTQHDTMDDLAPAALRAGIHLYAEALFRLANVRDLPFAREVNEAAQDASRRRRALPELDGAWLPATRKRPKKSRAGCSE